MIAPFREADRLEGRREGREGGRVEGEGGREEGREREGRGEGERGRDRVACRSMSNASVEIPSEQRGVRFDNGIALRTPDYSRYFVFFLCTVSGSLVRIDDIARFFGLVGITIAAI